MDPYRLVERAAEVDDVPLVNEDEDEEGDDGFDDLVRRTGIDRTSTRMRRAGNIYVE